MFHEAQQPAVIHVPSRSGITIRPEFLNCEDYLSLFAGGTETDLFKAVHEFAEKVYSAEPFVFLKALESAEANMSAKPDMSAEIAADLVKKFFTNGEPLEVNVGAEFVSTLTSDLGSANDDTERIVAAFAGVRQEAQRTAYLSSYKSFVQHYKGRL